MKITQEPQIINVRDFCNECGNCDSFCPTSGAPYKTKPRFHLTKESFDVESAGFRMGDRAIQYKKDNIQASLAFSEYELVYESALVSARFSQDTFKLKSYTLKSEVSAPIDLKHASEMFLLLTNLVDFSVVPFIDLH